MIRNKKQRLSLSETSGSQRMKGKRQILKLGKRGYLKKSRRKLMSSKKKTIVTRRMTTLGQLLRKWSLNKLMGNIQRLESLPRKAA